MYKKPHLRFFAVLAASCALFLVLILPAQAKGPFDSRYFISSQSSLLKTLFGVQHDFKKGFTADLTSGEVWALEKIFKTNVEAVPLYKITSDIEETVATSVVAESVKPVLEQGALKESAKPVKSSRQYNPENTVPWGIKKIYNNDAIVSTSGGVNVNVAVLDTGINTKHSDLVGRVSDCKDFTRGDTPRSNCQDQNGHGTHIAGIIAANGGSDGLGIWGVVSQTNVLAYKVCRNDGTCWADDVASAIEYAAQNRVDIISLSLGGNSESIVIKDAIVSAYQKNILIIASAGNDGPLKGSIDWPAAYSEVVAVSAIASDEIVPDWSSRGMNDGDYLVESREIEFAAPGVNIESTWMDGGYRYLSGTSMATPHVSGLAAKIWDGSATSTRSLLQTSSRDIWTIGDDAATGFGLPQLRITQ
jgi:subtilisin